MFTWEMSRVVVRRSREVRVREEETYCYATYCRWLYSDRCPDAGPRGPGAGPRPAAPPPIDPRSVLGSVAALTWRQPTGVLRSALLCCYHAMLLPLPLIPEFCLYLCIYL